VAGAAGLIMCIMLWGCAALTNIWKAARVDGIGTVKTYIMVIIQWCACVHHVFVLIASGVIKLTIAVVAGSGGRAFLKCLPNTVEYMLRPRTWAKGFAASTMMLCSVADHRSMGLEFGPETWLIFQRSTAKDRPRIAPRPTRANIFLYGTLSVMLDGTICCRFT
jgi:hypothetical protein